MYSKKFDWIYVPLSLVIRNKAIRNVIRFSTRNVFYIDFPIELYLRLVNYLVNIAGYYISLQKNEALKEFFINAKKSVQHFNEVLNILGLGWFKVVLARTPKYSKSRYIVKCIIKHNEFYDFVNKFINGEWGSLSDRYDYIYVNKSIYNTLIDLETYNQVKDMVRSYVANDLIKSEEILNDINTILSMESTKLKHYAKSFFSNNYIFAYEFTNYLHDWLSGSCITIDYIIRGQLIEYTPLLYRELRRIHENLINTLFIVNMLIKDYQTLTKRNISLSLKETYAYIALITWALSLWNTNEYFIKAREKKNIRSKNSGCIEKEPVAYITSIDKIIDKDVFNSFHEEIKSKYNIGRMRLKKLIAKNLSWSILLTLGSFRKHSINLSKVNPFINQDLLDEYIRELLKLAAIRIAELLGTEIRIDDALYSNIFGILYKLYKEYRHTIPYPSIKFMLQYSDIQLHHSVPIQNLYNQYSFFTHHYVGSTGLLPYLSILEYKIMPVELLKFKDVVSNICSLMKIGNLKGILMRFLSIDIK